MSEEITLEMIQEAMDLIVEHQPERIIHQDESGTIWGNGLGPTKIQFSKKTMEKLNFLFGLEMPLK